MLDEKMVSEKTVPDKMLAKRLKQLRKEKGISQRILAGAMQLSTSTIAMYETSQRDPDTNTLQRLADFFKVSVDFLLGRTEVKNMYGNEGPLDEFNEDSSEYQSPQQRLNERRKIEIFNKILEAMLDDGTLEEGFKFGGETEAVVMDRFEKIAKVYAMIYEDLKNS